MKKPELLAPAGNPECLRTALAFGADAVYLSGPGFGLRAYAPNFSWNEYTDALREVHDQDKKLYLAMNSLIRQEELQKLEQTLEFLAAHPPDALIFSDPAVPVMARKMGLDTSLHLSTQASTMNSEACRFWHTQGVTRIILARETTLQEIRSIRESLPDACELEAFVHGAMCIAYSGRCFLSAVATARSGNRGQCAQPCRWKYEVREAGTDDEFYTVVEGPGESYLFNSRDLMMLEHIPELVEAGVSSLKVEGRMKSAYYVASAVHAYRAAIDAYSANREIPLDALREELSKSATRLHTTGFYFGNPGPEGQDTQREFIPRRYTFAARVLGPGPPGFIEVEQRNKFCVGDQLEILAPKGGVRRFKVREIQTRDGTRRDSAPHAQEHLYVSCPYQLNAGDILRRPDTEPIGAVPHREE